MTRTEHLLTIVAEECAEVAQRCSKALRFGLTEVQPGQPLNNAERIAYEYADLVAVMILLSRECDGVLPNIADGNLEVKRSKIEHYLEYSRIVGCLNSQPRTAEPCEAGTVQAPQGGEAERA